jgi:poly-gamma-glutamate synthesis protein (capsule biosynthesis protein)
MRNQKNLTFLLTLFLAACVAALFLSFIVFKIIYPAPAEQTELKFCRAENLTTAPKEEPPVKLLFFGDIMLDRHVKEKIKQKGFDYLFSNFKLPIEWRQPEIMAANLEGAVTTGGKHYPPEISIDFAFDPKDVAQLKNYNFNFFSIANNHITDQGQTGFLETQQNLDKLGFNYAGCADKKVGECSLKIMEVNGVKIGTLSYSMVYGVLDEEKLLTQIKDAKTQADLVIVNMHWGVEYEQKSRKNIQTLGHKIIDAGADILIGGHPHVVQEMEIYAGKPIFYSLGNFIFDQYFSRETQEGLAVGINWQDKKIAITLFPLQSKSSQVELMAGDKKQEFLNWLAEISKVNENYKEQIKSGNIVIASETK